MSFPRYESYRDSDIDWIGDVPIDWEIRPIKAVAQLFGRIGFRGYTTADIVDEGEGAITLSPSNMDGGGMAFENCTYISWEKYHESPEIMIQPNDVLMVKTGSTLGKVAFVPECDHDMTVNPQIVVFKQITCNARFLFYFLSTPYIQSSVLVKNAGSSIPTITQESIGNFRVLLPQKDEQIAIAQFLDRETAKIDDLIAEQQRLIELLKEKRQAVISHAVTKGLNPDAPMKDSGIEWLGDVPAHWEVVPLKRVFQFVTSGSRGWAQHYSDDGALFLRIGNLTRNSIDLDLSDIQRVTVPQGAEGERTRVQPGDILFSVTAYLGSVAVIPPGLESAYVSQHVALVRLVLDQVLPRWVAYASISDSGKTWFDRQAYGGTKIQLSLEDVACLPIPLPPISEQKELVGYIDTQIASFASLEFEVARAIELLQERRTALISAAVTGKIDVREHAPAEAV